MDMHRRTPNPHGSSDGELELKGRLLVDAKGVFPSDVEVERLDVDFSFTRETTVLTILADLDAALHDMNLQILLPPRECGLVCDLTGESIDSAAFMPDLSDSRHNEVVLSAYHSARAAVSRDVGRYILRTFDQILWCPAIDGATAAHTCLCFAVVYIGDRVGEIGGGTAVPASAPTHGSAAGGALHSADTHSAFLDLPSRSPSTLSFPTGGGAPYQDSSTHVLAVPPPKYASLLEGNPVGHPQQGKSTSASPVENDCLQSLLIHRDSSPFDKYDEVSPEMLRLRSSPAALAEATQRVRALVQAEEAKVQAFGTLSTQDVTMLRDRWILAVEAEAEAYERATRELQLAAANRAAWQRKHMEELKRQNEELEATLQTCSHFNDDKPFLEARLQQLRDEAELLQARELHLLNSLIDESTNSPRRAVTAGNDAASETNGNTPVLQGGSFSVPPPLPPSCPPPQSAVSGAAGFSGVPDTPPQQPVQCALNGTTNEPSSLLYNSVGDLPSPSPQPTPSSAIRVLRHSGYAGGTPDARPPAGPPPRVGTVASHRGGAPPGDGRAESEIESLREITTQLSTQLQATSTSPAERQRLLKDIQLLRARLENSTSRFPRDVPAVSAPSASGGFGTAPTASETPSQHSASERSRSRQRGPFGGTRVPIT